MKAVQHAGDKRPTPSPNRVAASGLPPGSRVGIMGGSFDPVHRAHVSLAESAVRHLLLDQVRWIPVGQAWQKARELSAPEHRAAMVREAIAHEPRFVLDDIELQRPGPSFTIDTLRALQRLQPGVQDWVLIIGLDQYNNLPSWHGWQDLLSDVTLAVASRGPTQPQVPEALRSHPHRMVHLPMDPMPVSSTDIRQRLVAGESPASLVPDLLPTGVARYIAQHQLYAPRATR